jgi:hypothetical protein
MRTPNATARTVRSKKVSGKNRPDWRANRLYPDIEAIFGKRFFCDLFAALPRRHVTNLASRRPQSLPAPRDQARGEPIEISRQTAIWVKRTSERDGGAC